MTIKDPYVDEDDDSPLASGPLRVMRGGVTQRQHPQVGYRTAMAWWTDYYLGFRVVRTVEEGAWSSETP